MNIIKKAYSLQKYTLNFNCLKIQSLFSACTVSIHLEVVDKRGIVATAKRYGRDWPVHGEDVFEVSWGVDQRGQTEPEEGGVLTVENDAAIDNIQEQLQVVIPAKGAGHWRKQCVYQLNK